MLLLFCTVVTVFYMLFVSFNVQMFAFLKWLQSGHIRMGEPKIPYATRAAGWLSCNPPPSKMWMGHSLPDKFPWLPNTPTPAEHGRALFTGNDATATLLLQEDSTLIQRKCPAIPKGVWSNSFIIPSHKSTAPRWPQRQHSNICFQVL